MKKCNKCELEKELSEFYKNSKAKDGYFVRCKECCKSPRAVKPVLETYDQKSQRKLQELRERNAEQQKLEKEKAAEKVSKVRKQCARRYKETPIEKVMLWRAKARAKKQKLPFDLTVEDIIIPETCPILGIPIYRSDKGRVNSPSLDRIIPEYGYTKHNVQVISNRANTLKSNATPQELLLFAKWSMKYFGKRGGRRAVTDQK